MEPKVGGAGVGVLTAGGLGLLIVWLVDTFTSVSMPVQVGEVLGMIVLAVVGAVGGGYLKSSQLSGASRAYDADAARDAQARILQRESG